MAHPADALAKRAMHVVLENDYFIDYVRPMGSLVVRFSAKKLAHVGKAVDAALTLAFEALAPHASRELVFRGYWPNGKKTVRYHAPRAGRHIVSAGLAAIKKLPDEAMQLYFFDGEGDALPPKGAALYVSLAADHGNTFCTGLGFLSIAFPLSSLADPTWKALGDALVALLDAEVAWLSPSIWLAPQNLFNGSLNDFDDEEVAQQLFAKEPQLDVPSFYASRAPFSFDDLKPAPLAGMITPAWVMWFAEPLAKRIPTFGGDVKKLATSRRYQLGEAPPFVMTPALYETWRRRWAELAPVHVTAGDIDECAAYFVTRFAAERLADIGPMWRRERASRAAAEKRHRAMVTKLEQLSGTKLMTYADSIARSMTADLARVFLPKLAEEVRDGRVAAEIALVWLDICEQVEPGRFVTLLAPAAAVAAAAGDATRALDLLRRYLDANSIAPRSLARDPAYKPLRKDARFVKLTARH